MIVTLQNLRAGVDAWMSRPGWPSDPHAPLYGTLAGLRADGLTQEWWTQVVNHLASWRAIRPQKKADILWNGRAHLDALSREYDAISTACNRPSPSLGDCAWPTVEGLYHVAHSIKGSATPVFGSKLCHFILPDMFPVIDWDLIGVSSPEYRPYWQLCRQEWSACPNQSELIEEVSPRVAGEYAPVFPWATKITELCIAGDKAV